MLLIDAAGLEQRARVVQGPLAQLHASLARDLDDAVRERIRIPRDKALLSRTGGRCERDGTALEFDPLTSGAHRCPSCGSSWTGALHDRAWNTWYHLWLAERALQAALLHNLETRPQYAAFARNVLRSYADAYLKYPNRDNVLGPARPFFSTYLESIWLLQICIAADLVEQSGDRWTADVVRDQIVAPSRALIAGFDERMSNRQVWNNAALLASALFLRDQSAAEQVVHAESGLVAHLAHGLLSDGTWFEGDNYHQFAIRGLWYAVSMCEANGIAVPRDRTQAFDRGVAATFASALPDFTFPSRKDSQYAVSLRQWRFAELAELGFARTRDDELLGALARCYVPGLDRSDTGRSRSTADAERNAPSCLLTRADLGWRALLHALPELPPLQPTDQKSVHLTGQGLAIFRRAGGVYAALDYGQSGAGHGHPDRLNLLLAQGATRWLDDLGTGSYVEKSLHWYRSSLAHNAPFVDGHSQASGDGALAAYDERAEFGWVEAKLQEGDVALTRTIVVAPGYMVGELAWSAPRDVQVDVPWHVDAAPPDLAFQPETPDGGAGLEDGFDFVREWEACAVRAGQTVTLRARADNRTLSLALQARGVATLIRATGPGQPAAKYRPFYMVRLRGAQGRLRSVLAWDPSAAADLDSDRIRVQLGAERHVHARTMEGWRVEVTRAGRTEVTELGGRVKTRRLSPVAPATSPRSRVAQPYHVAGWWSELTPADRKRFLVVELGEANYRRSEESWREAGSPSATVAIAAANRALSLLIDVRAANQRFVAAAAANPLDNEHADTMGAGVQLYLDAVQGRGMWMLVPEVGGDHVRVREIAGSSYPSRPGARWRPRDSGYELRIDLPFATDHQDVKEFGRERLREVDLTIVINDGVEGRERRRGQLVTGDARGEFVYLRGDREGRSHALRLDIAAI